MWRRFKVVMRVANLPYAGFWIPWKVKQVVSPLRKNDGEN